jgi:U3 small nucleolar RNA-associated protein 5
VEELGDEGEGGVGMGLHSSDTRLLETCLAHSDQTLIRNTVRQLPPQLAVPLITACVERLGRGARAGSMKGGGGGASEPRHLF